MKGPDVGDDCRELDAESRTGENPLLQGGIGDRQKPFEAFKLVGRAPGEPKVRVTADEEVEFLCPSVMRTVRRAPPPRIEVVRHLRSGSHETG